MGFNFLKDTEPLWGNTTFITSLPSILSFSRIDSKFSCDVLRDLVAVVQFKKREKHPWRSVTLGKDAGS